jgi:hypothetical protein
MNEEQMYYKNIYSKEIIEHLEKMEKNGTLGGDPYEELQHARGFRSCLFFSNGFQILDERYEKRIRRDGSVVIKVFDPKTDKVKSFVCNEKTGIVFVPAWNGEQHFRM